MDNNTILGLTETWFDANDSDSIWNVDNEKCEFLRSDRSPKMSKNKVVELCLLFPYIFHLEI